MDAKASLFLEDPSTVARIQAQGTDLAVWTVNEPAEASALLAMGVRRITTDQVGALLEWKTAAGG